MSHITGNLERIREQIAEAASKSGRDADEISLVAVTKYARLDFVRELIELNIVDLGEARPQQLQERAPRFPHNIRWHLIGHLQRNKARRILPLTSLIHSVDTTNLLATIDRIAGDYFEEYQEPFCPCVLLQVNVSGEGAKQGFTPDELLQLWPELSCAEFVQICGLMTMAPRVDDVEETRPIFAGLRELRDQLAAKYDAELPELSMGMSRDFEVAIEEGATIIRIGSRLFSEPA